MFIAAKLTMDGWVAVTVGIVAVAVCLTVLFLLVFPLLNKYLGTDFPCRNFKSVRERGRKHKGENGADVSWVPTVQLPEMTGKRAALRPSDIKTVYYRTTDKK